MPAAPATGGRGRGGHPASQQLRIVRNVSPPAKRDPRDPIGVVCPCPGGFFTRLACVTPDAKRLGRRIWLVLAAAAGVGVVVLSWRVPEPQTRPVPAEVESMSYLKITPQPQVSAPSYGAR